ncbi:DNA internalization-related competence protein ComEC/Rec2 [Colwellia sp. E150_009]
MDWWLANFFLGAIFSLFLPVVPDLFVLISLLLLSFFFFYFPFKQPIIHFVSLSGFYYPLRLSSGLLFGASWMLFNAFTFQHLWQENKLDVIELSNKAQWIQGEVLSLHAPTEQPESTENTLKISSLIKSEDKLSQINRSNSQLRFNLSVTHLNNIKLASAIQFRLSWKKANLALQQGQSVNLYVKFKPAHGLANQGGFSYQTWLNSKMISATGYVINHKDNRLLNGESSLRQQLFNDYTALLTKNSDKNALAPLLLALGFGSRTALTQDLWQVLQVTGTGHLIAISGLHIGLVATGCFYSVMLLLRLLPLLLFVQSYKLQTTNFRYYAIGLSMMAAFSYGYLAGFSLPTVRALVMLSFYWLIRLLALNISVTRWLLLTLFIITLTTPFSLFTASFWLSVYAVTVIFLTLWRFKNILNTGHIFWRFIKGLIVIQLSLTVMLLPISAVFFQQVTLVALFANIIAVPWMSFISIPLCLLSVLTMHVSDTLSHYLVLLSLASLEAIWSYLTYLSTTWWAVIPLSSIDIQFLFFCGLAIVLWAFLQPKFSYQIKGKKRIVMLCFLLIFISLIPALNKKLNKQLPHWQLVVFDVGQGLSILIQRDNKAILYDTGAAYDSGFNMIEAVVLPYLQFAGIQRLDKVIISHGDNDHAGGLKVLQQSIVVDELIYNTSKDVESSTCLQGELFFWQNLTIEMLWPDQKIAQENDDSCVLLITDNKHKVLLTGDISKKIESKLMQKYPSLQADVLIVPHHGSKTSSSKMFIEQVNPKIAVVSAGFLNRWRMPVTEVVNRYQQYNIQLLNSAKLGQVTINFSENDVSYYTYHDNLWPFWFAKSPW